MKRAQALAASTRGTLRTHSPGALPEKKNHAVRRSALACGCQCQCHHSLGTGCTAAVCGAPRDGSQVVSCAALSALLLWLWQHCSRCVLRWCGAESFRHNPSLIPNQVTATQSHPQSNHRVGTATDPHNLIDLQYRALLFPARALWAAIAARALLVESRTRLAAAGQSTAEAAVELIIFNLYRCTLLVCSVPLALRAVPHLVGGDLRRDGQSTSQGRRRRKQVRRRLTYPASLLCGRDDLILAQACQQG